ncbi:MAG: aminodeoxychorismate synthase component I [Actinomycetota bacterium]
MTEARFDDLRSSPPRSFRFAGHVGAVEARSPDEVPALLAAIEDAARSGRWAAGYLSSEAAPGLNPDLVVRDRPEGDPFAELPLARFDLYERRDDVMGLSPPSAAFSVWRWEPSIARPDYDRQIERVREYIRAGDTYQVNHTIRLRGRFAGTDRAFYTALALAQRGGHCAYLDLGRYRILSASPEMFFRLDDDGALTTRPMKGTALRGRWPAEDREFADTLVATEKERAENAMIVDLLRNDMGRISEPSSVRVTELFGLERYETVWQLTSTISSQLRGGLGVADVFRALFPSGSVTGAPKVRSMQIIAELETLPRGVYCGAVGWIAPQGAPGPRAEFNVAIRTVVLDTETDTVEYGVGGGITFDSVAELEYSECLAKARVLTERRPAFRLLESVGYRAGEVLWLDRHLDRMEASSSYFGFAFDRDAANEAILSCASEAEGDAKIRLLVDREGAFTCASEPLDPLPPEPERPVVTIELDGEPIDPDDVFLFHKTTVRRTYESALARHPDVDDVIMVNRSGEVTEASSSNVAARLGDHWFTPHVGSGLLAGTYRAVLLDEGRIRERRITVDDLRSADEIALLNSVRLWRPARLRERGAPLTGS